MSDESRKVLVTGGAGFIGSHVVDAYCNRGDRVWVVDDLSSGRLENLRPDVEFVHSDIGDPGVRDLFVRPHPELTVTREKPGRSAVNSHR